MSPPEPPKGGRGSNQYRRKGTPKPRDPSNAAAQRLRDLANRAAHLPPAPAPTTLIPGRTLEGISTELAASRRALLDALDALSTHRAGLTVVGAHAVYEHTRHRDLGFDASTSDADLSVDPDLIANDPPIGSALQNAGFTEADRGRPGMWSRQIGAAGVTVDLLVPETFAGPGRRGARLRNPHGSRAATRAKGLELTLVDREIKTLSPFEVGDKRTTEIAVAGPTALLCAKAYKLTDRIDKSPARVRPKDAADVWLLMDATNPDEVAARFSALARHADARIAEVARKGRDLFAGLFTPDGDGHIYARQALAPLAPNEVDAVLVPWMTRFLSN